MPKHTYPSNHEDPLATALAQYGRRARKLSAARLRTTAVVLDVLRCDYCAAGNQAVPLDAHAFSVRVEQVLYAAIKSLTDSVDGRIAQAILASEPEFWDKTVSQRRAFVATHDRGFSDEQFKARRQRVLHDIADALREELARDHP